jgi:hypothetical protein
MEKHIRKNGEGECWWSRIASPYPDANNVAPPATNDEKEFRTRSLSRCNRRLLHALTTTAQQPLKRRQPQTTFFPFLFKNEVQEMILSHSSRPG